MARRQPRFVIRASRPIIHPDGRARSNGGCVQEPWVSEFRDAVRAAAVGTPYTVVDTKRGFDVQVDIVDAQWWGLFNRAGLRSSFRWRVAERRNHYTITDSQVKVDWSAGAPRFGGSWEMQAGRIPTLSRQRIWALSDRGRVERVVDYRFNSREGRDLIRLVGRQLHLEERQPWSVRITWVFVLITPAFFAGYGLLRLVLWLIGAHP